MAEPTAVPAAPYERMLGLEVLELGEERAAARLAVHDGVRQPMGLVHGGALASAAEALAVRATAHALGGAAGPDVRGLATAVNFLRPLLEGTVHIEAARRHRGRTTWLWDVELRDDAGRVCSLARVTVAVSPRPS